MEKYEILKPIKFNQKVKKGDVIAELKNRKVIAQFDGVIGKREFYDVFKVKWFIFCFCIFNGVIWF